MRYFKYKNTDKNKENALKEQYEMLSGNEKRIFRKKKLLEKLGAVLAGVIFLACVWVGTKLILLIPTPTVFFLEILAIIADVILGLIMLIVSVIITAILTTPLWNKIESLHVPNLKKEIISKASAHLREFYGLNEPYIITKCFESTDKKFIDCDVCIFICGDELRITKDIVHGFLYGEKDLGCYAFKADEITLAKQIDGKCLRCELSSDDVTFLLGYRAEKYISENFISNK